MAAQPLENNRFLGLVDRVNRLYFWTEVGAEKSVKYNVLTSATPFAAAGRKPSMIFSELNQ